MTERAQRWLVVIASLFLAMPLLVFAYPPMTDLPHHEALVGLLRHFGDPTLYPPGLYVRNLGQPNQLFHLVAWPLSYVLGVTLSCKLVTAAAVAGVPLGALRLARALKAPPIAAMALAPVAVGWLFTWGFVNNLLALAIFFFLLPDVDRLVEVPTRRRLALVTSEVVLLYLAHELVMFVFLGAIFLFAILRVVRERPRSLERLRPVAIAVVPGVTGLLIALAQIKLQEKLKTDSVKMVPNAWLSVATKFAEVPSALVGGADKTMRHVLFTLLCSFVALLSVDRYLPSRVDPVHSMPLSERLPSAGASRRAALVEDLHTHRFELLALSSFVLFLAAPFTFNGAMLVHERFLAPAFGIITIAVAASGIRASRRTRSRRAAAVLAAALPIAALFPLLPWFGDASRNYQDMEKLFARIPLDSSVAGIDLDLDQGGRPFTVASGLSRVLSERGGRTLYSFSESTVAPVMLAPGHQWNEPSARIMFDNLKFRPRHDFTRFRYLLVHLKNVSRLRNAVDAFFPEGRWIGTEGEWALFESTLDVVPLTAPDVPLPVPHPETIGRRLWFLEHSAPPPMVPPLSLSAQAMPAIDLPPPPAPSGSVQP